MNQTSDCSPSAPGCLSGSLSCLRVGPGSVSFSARGVLYCLNPKGGTIRITQKSENKSLFITEAFMCIIRSLCTILLTLFCHLSAAVWLTVSPSPAAGWSSSDTVSVYLFAVSVAKIIKQKHDKQMLYNMSLYLLSSLAACQLLCWITLSKISIFTVTSHKRSDERNFSTKTQVDLR